jgi:hypothetical protein
LCHYSGLIGCMVTDNSENKIHNNIKMDKELKKF